MSCGDALSFVFQMDKKSVAECSVLVHSNPLLKTSREYRKTVLTIVSEGDSLPEHCMTLSHLSFGSSESLLYLSAFLQSNCYIFWNLHFCKKQTQQNMRYLLFLLESMIQKEIFRLTWMEHDLCQQIHKRCFHPNFYLHNYSSWLSRPLPLRKTQNGSFR